MAATAEESTPEGRFLAFLLSLVFAAVLFRDPFDVVLGVLRRKAPRGQRSSRYVWVLGACAAFLTHASNYTARRTGSPRRTASGALPLGQLPGAFARANQGGRVEPPLTEEEERLLKLFVAGRTIKEIASELAISPETVRAHVQNILADLAVHSRLDPYSGESLP
jgi:DNA-binding CsgD family transcriptional regulator